MSYTQLHSSTKTKNNIKITANEILYYIILCKLLQLSFFNNKKIQKILQTKN